MRMPEQTRESHQLNQLASKLQDEAEITGVNASGTQISSRAFEMNTEYEPAGDQPEAIKKLVDGVARMANSQLFYTPGKGFIEGPYRVAANEANAR